jgi:tetratricopeptide (TPR) repeat protein
MKNTSLLLALFAAAAFSGCASEPVKDIRGIFQRGTETTPASADAASTGGGERELKQVEKSGDSKPEPQSTEASIAPSRKGAPQLVAGIQAYEDGKYREASKILRSALPRLGTADQVQAHKYLAFIDCTSGRTNQCRNEFAKALKIDPAFELGPAEAGHPAWGPVFRSVKKKRQR